MIPAPVFQVWDETGTTGLSVLGAVADWAISDVRCDVGSLTLTVVPQVGGEPVAGVSDLLVDADRQIRVLLQGAPDLWFVVDDDAWAGVSDAPDSEPRTLACRSLAAVLDEVHVTSEVAYTAASPGAPVAALFANAQGRGFLQGLTLTGGSGFDAGGHTWPTPVTVTYKAGTSLLAMLKGLSDARLLEWRLNGRALEIHKTGGDLDRSRTTLFLRPGADVAAAPVQRSRKDVATHALVVATDGNSTTRSQALTGRRKREAVVQQSDGSTASTVGDLYLAAHAVSNVQLTHDLTDSDDTPVPWVDYRPGDRMPTVAAGGGVTLWRVEQIAMAARSGQTAVSLELGSILRSADERFADQLAHLQSGAVVLTS